MLERLIQSAIAFRLRFNLPDDVYGSMEKLGEEISELQEALIQYRYYDHGGFFRSEAERHHFKQAAILEFIDVIYAGVNLFLALGFNLPTISGYVESVIKKNDEKNLSNCTVVNGQVVRNEKLGK